VSDTDQQMKDPMTIATLVPRQAGVAAREFTMADPADCSRRPIPFTCYH